MFVANTIVEPAGSVFMECSIAKSSMRNSVVLKSLVTNVSSASAPCGAILGVVLRAVCLRGFIYLQDRFFKGPVR